MIKKIATVFALSISTANAAFITINDASFENTDIAANSFQYAPASPDWTFSASAGLVDPFAPLISSEAPDGAQFGFIQQTGSFSQDIFFPSTGNYTISYLEAGRIDVGGSLDYQISVGGSVVHTDSTLTAQAFSLVETTFFTTAGIQTLSFDGLTVTDNTAFFDAISINELAPVPVPAAAWLFGSGLIGLIGVGRRSKKLSDK